MNSKIETDNLVRINRYTFFVYIVWVVLVASSLLWNLFSISRQIDEFAKSEARSYFGTEIALVNWAASQREVSVPLTKQTSSNVDLNFNTNRNFQLSSKDTLPLIKPVDILRQHNELSASNSIVGHLTSLKPIQLQNVPSEWERKSLLDFEKGISEVFEFDYDNGDEILRLMKPLIAKKNCLKCHSSQGYKVGDICGGMSIIVPMKQFWSNSREDIVRVIALHISLLIIGFIGIKSVKRRFSKRLIENDIIKDALREKDERLKLALSVINAGVWDWNIKKRSAILDERWEEISGYTLSELEPVDIEIWNKLVHPDDIEELGLLLEEHYLCKTDYFKYETRIKHKNDEWVWVLIRGKVIERQNDNKPIRMVGVIIDITERKNHEHELIDAKKKLEEENANKDKFFAIISHDLKAPFGALLGIAQFLDEGYDEMEIDEIKEMIHVARSSATNIYELLDGLLEWSRAKSGRMDFSPSVINIHNITTSVIDTLTHNAKRKNIDLVCSIKTDSIAFADEIMVLTIIRNLITNAIKFTQQNGKIVVSSKTNKYEVEISVLDNGIGISEEDINKLFKIEIHHTTIGTFNEAGTGVGLILCKELVNKNGGKIWVESELEKGSNFKFTLPLKS